MSHGAGADEIRAAVEASCGPLCSANGDTVLIDWAFAGIGGLGEESGQPGL